MDVGSKNRPPVDSLEQTFGALAALSAEMTRAATEKEVLQLVARYTTNLVASERVSVAVLDPGATLFTVLALTGDAVIPVATQMPCANTAVGRTVVAMELLRFEVSEESPLADLQQLAKAGIRATMNAPLIVLGEVIGTINVGTVNPDAWDDGAERLFAHWAAMVSSSLEVRRTLHDISEVSMFVSLNPNPVLRVAGDGIVIIANDAAIRIFGAACVLGKNLTEGLHFAPDVFEVALREGESVIELKHGGRSYEVDLQRCGESQTVNMYAREVTEARQLRFELDAARRLKAVGSLAGGIAHDFNNLLMTIGYASEFLLERCEHDKEALEEIQAIRAGYERATELTRGLLRFSRSEPQSLKAVFINRVLDELHPMLRHVVGEQIQLELCLSTTTPAIWADRGQIEQVLMNLVLNACQAMPEGGKLRIETTVDDGAMVVVRVVDSGVGMDEEVRERIFEPFFSTKKDQGCTGLGLSTVYGIVNQHQGSIAVNSSPAGGTTFFVKFPVSNHQEPCRLPSSPSKLQLSGLRVLLVEDLEPVRRVTGNMLRAIGCEVVGAASSSEALKLVPPARFDVVVSDMLMPNMSGRELVKRLLVQLPHLLVLFISGYEGDNVQDPKELRDNSRFLAKPFTSVQLLAAMRELLG